MKIKFPQKAEFVCTEFEISKHLSQKVLKITFLCAGEIWLNY